ncbi:MAG: polyprenol monophosphomannose synthase [Pirellulaceae bacterium]|nr:polyprenol monophosphomannose synthase [Planctomycetales bacterium]
MHATRSDTLVAVATYNEIANVPQLIEGITATVPHADIVVIDDNSPDGTGQWCETKSRQLDRLLCLHRTDKLGLGSATNELIRHAVEQRYRYLVTLDADLSHPPGQIADLLHCIDQAAVPRPDVVIGSRYVNGGQIIGWPLHRRIMSRLVNTFARWTLRLPVRDCSGAFRCYRVECLRHLELDRIESRGYSYFEEILWRLHRQGAVFAEVPIHFVERQHGRTKITWYEAVSSVCLLARLGWQQWFGDKRSVSRSKRDRPSVKTKK